MAVDARIVVAWVLAALAFGLLGASLAGSGAGVAGMGMMTSMLWSYVFVGAVLVLLLTVATPKEGTA
ncbi:MAG: hypothetical protein ACT4PT_11215 [Methanobacteriota archaeon]